MQRFTRLTSLMPVVGVFLIGLSCNDLEQVVNVEPGPGGGPGASTGHLTGRVHPAGSGARVIASQAAPVDSASIDSTTGAFTVADLRPGTYDVLVRADNHRLVCLERVSVYAGSVTYVGALTLSTVPDPVRSFAPADRSEVVMSPQGRLAIGIDFEVSMDRLSVLAAFSTQPPAAGVYYWSQFPAASGTDYTGAREGDVAPPGYNEVPGGEITSYRNIRSLRFIPRQRDTFVDSSYTVTLAASAHDSAGVAMRFPLRFSFTTIQSGVTQTAIETQPEDGERGVSLLSFSSIRVTFPKRMNRLSVEGALTMTPPTSPIFLWLADNDLALYTGGPLQAETTYAVHIGTSAEDLDGVPLPEPFQFSFDTEAVAIRSTSPGNGQIFVDFSTDLRIHLWFNTYIVRSTLASAWSTSPAAAGQFVWTDNTNVYFRPATPLLPNTRYTVTIGDALRDLHGASLPAPYAFAFVTRPE